EPAVAGHRGLRLRLASELADLVGARVDVVGREVVIGVAAPVVGGEDGSARPLARLCHPVVDPGHPRILEAPADEAVPEPRPAVRILRRELDVDDLTRHLRSFQPTLQTAANPTRAASRQAR